MLLCDVGREEAGRALVGIQHFNQIGRYRLSALWVLAHGVWFLHDG